MRQKTETLSERVAVKIRQYIIENELKAGDRLPNELQMAEYCEVGRGTVRDAVKLLRFEGLVIAPGYMDTEMCASMSQERKDECTKRIAAGRWGTPEDLKGPILFLASSASDYLNGAVIPVDGGFLVKS